MSVHGTDLPWRQKAACKGKPLSWFFPPEHHDPYVRWQPPKEALELCARCPVSRECDQAGEREFGLWSGRYRSEKHLRTGKPLKPWPRSRDGLYRCFDCSGDGQPFLSERALWVHRFAAHREQVSA